MHDKFRTGGRMDGFLVIAKTGLDFTASKKGRWVNRWVGWDSGEEFGHDQPVDGIEHVSNR